MEYSTPEPKSRTTKQQLQRAAMDARRSGADGYQNTPELGVTVAENRATQVVRALQLVPPLETVPEKTLTQGYAAADSPLTQTEAMAAIKGKAFGEPIEFEPPQATANQRRPTA